MNNSDKKKLVRIYCCMRIPGCHLGPGTQSASIHGIASYAKDASYALPRLMDLVYLAREGDSYDGEFEEKMSSLEDWFKKRAEENWS